MRLFWNSSGLTKKAQTELFGGQLARVVEELGKRDFSDVPTPKLMDMLVKLNAKLEEVSPAPSSATSPMSPGTMRCVKRSVRSPQHMIHSSAGTTTIT